METMKFYTLEEIENKYLGTKGTLKCSEYEKNFIHLIGYAIKQVWQSKNLT
ncbi:MAG: hypothetical protein PARBA_02509 [Parabacteroides sp.]